MPESVAEITQKNYISRFLLSKCEKAKPCVEDWSKLPLSPSIFPRVVRFASLTGHVTMSSTQAGLQVLWSFPVGFYKSDLCLLPCLPNVVGSLLVSSMIRLWIWILALLYQASGSSWEKSQNLVPYNKRFSTLHFPIGHHQTYHCFHLLKFTCINLPLCRTQLNPSNPRCKVQWTQSLSQVMLWRANLHEH